MATEPKHNGDWFDDEEDDELCLDDENDDEEDDDSDIEYGDKVYFGLDDDDYPDCPKCGSSNVIYRGGDNVVNVSGAVFSRTDFYECGDCGHEFRI